MDKDLKDLKIAIIGGDKRQAVIADRFVELGYDVRIFAVPMLCGIGNGTVSCMSVDKAMEGADIVLLPLPVSRDNVNLFTGGERILLSDVVRIAVKYGSLIYGGMIPDDMLRQCAALNLEVCDYYKSEDLQRKNALPSAEGALMLAMEHTDITVKGMKALVCGYGRIGSLLSDMLCRLGASVTVAARRDETLCEISCNGLRAVRIGNGGGELAEEAGNCDVVFNTVPSIIFTERILKSFKKKPLYIEIASSPGGIDIPFARGLGMEIVFAPSLPGKYSPISAGKYIFETVYDSLKERGKL